MEAKQKADDKPGGATKQLVLGLIFGLVFGVLLQKGGVAKYHVLVGVLLLEDFTVVKVMLTAIVVGMVGVLSLHGLGLVKLHVEPTRLAANVLGGILFGVGFALLAYCPGTGAAALGQGNYDAVAGVLGLLAGSDLFAEASGALDRTVLKWGDHGELTGHGGPFPGDLSRCHMRPRLTGVGLASDWVKECVGWLARTLAGTARLGRSARRPTTSPDVLGAGSPSP